MIKDFNWGLRDYENDDNDLLKSVKKVKNYGKS